MVHVHLLYYGAFIPIAWLAAAARLRGLGEVCWIEAAVAERDVRYTSKDIIGYTSKDTTAGGRIITSDGWLAPPSFDDRLHTALSGVRVSREVSRTPPKRPTRTRRACDLTDYKQQAGSWPIERRLAYHGLGPSELKAQARAGGKALTKLLRTQSRS